MKQIIYRIEGMSCAACSARIERVLRRSDGISSAAVNLTAGKAYVSFQPELISEEEIIQKIEKLGYGVLPPTAEQEQLYRFSDFFLAALFLLLLLYVSMGSHMLGLPLPAFLSHHTAPLNFALLELALTLPVVYIGRRFYLHGLPQLFRGSPNMDSLIAVGTSAALIYSFYALVQIAMGEESYVAQLYFETAAMIITLVLLGKSMEERAKGKADSAVRQLLDLAPAEALVERDGVEQVIPVSEVLAGDIVIVRSGSRLPVDGTVLSGKGSVDEAYLTGESLPRTVQSDAEVIGGTVNLAGTFRYRATRVGFDTVLSQIARLMEEAQAGKAPIARTADKVAAVFVPVVLGIALLAGIVWLISGANVAFALRIFISVLIIACPCALGLATPTALTVAMGRAARFGVLIKNGAVLEEAAHVKQIAFDKTGTITEGKPSLLEVRVCAGFTEKDVLQDAYQLEKYSEHPLATAVIAAAEAQGISVLSTELPETWPGQGLSGRAGERSLLLGNCAFLKSQKVNCSELTAVGMQQEELGATVVYIAADQKLAGALVFADRVRTESKEAITQLQKEGLETVLLTGDHNTTAQAVAAQVGIKKVIADILPAGKARAILELQKSGKILMIGDGINDAPALKQADVGIAVKNGTDIAVESADIVFRQENLGLTLWTIRLAKATLRIIKQNLVWAFFYNVIGIPIAAGLLYLFGGPLLHPAFGAAAMSLSSISVVSNALRLKTIKL